jgi:hypothetical protein
MSLLSACVIGFWNFSCARPSRGLGTNGAIVFTIIGKHPFEDSGLVLGLERLNTQVFLRGKSPRSYVFIAANALRSPMLVTTRELIPPGNEVRSRLYLYDPRAQTWDAINSFLPMAFEGTGALASNGQTVAITLASPATPGSYDIWWVDTVARTHKKLTNAGNQTWDSLPVLRPDGQQIVFLRLHRTPKGLISVLMSVPSGGGSETIILGEGEGVAAACYDPDGQHLAVWTRIGLEIIDERASSRRTVLPWSQIPGFSIHSSSMSWSKQHGRIAFSLLNQKTGRYELWWISPEGQDFKRLYEGTDSTISSVSFVSTSE